MTTRERITRSLTEAFRPLELEVVDESERHKGHAGYREGGETHFRVVIRSPAFKGLSRLEIHRLIHQNLASELRPRSIHALAIEASSQ